MRYKTNAKHAGSGPWVRAKNIFLVIFGTLVLAFGTGVFTIPFNLVTGGISSMAIILRALIPIEILTVDFYVTVITWLFFAAGFLLFGRRFAVRTFISTLVYPTALSLFVKLSSPDTLGGFLYLGEDAVILAAVFGGAAVGAGCAITFLGGGSTGGVDIIALGISGRFPKIKSSSVLFITDTVLIVLGMLVIRDFKLSLLGISSAFVSAIAVDKIFLGSNRAFIANIISEKHEEINREIIKNVKRTTTIVSARGGFTKRECCMLMVSFSHRQYAELISAVNRIDKNAFITVHSAHEINGEGGTFGEHD